MYDDDDDPMPTMDPECHNFHPEPENVMRADRENYWTCPGCKSPDFYMGDPRCPKCGWHG